MDEIIMMQNLAFPSVRYMYTYRKVVPYVMMFTASKVAIPVSSRDPLRFARLLRNGLHVSLQQRKT